MLELKYTDKCRLAGNVEVPCHISRNKRDHGIDLTLRINMNGVSVKDLINAALPNIRIKWQNSVGRKNIDMFTANQVVDVDFTKPTEYVIPREVKIDAYKRQLIASGIDELTAETLAVKLVDNPELARIAR